MAFFLAADSLPVATSAPPSPSNLIVGCTQSLPAPHADPTRPLLLVVDGLDEAAGGDYTEALLRWPSCRRASAS